MAVKQARRAQLRLTLPVRSVEIPREIERRLIDALAELLLLVATADINPTQGGSDERQDPR